MTVTIIRERISQKSSGKVAGLLLFSYGFEKARAEHLSPARRDITVKVVTAVQKVVSSWVGVFERR